MKIKVNAPVVGMGNKIELQEIKLDDVRTSAESIMSIDGSTDTTGVAIVRKSDIAFCYSIAFTREKDESPVQYKVRLKRSVTQLLRNNKDITEITYEEPFIGHITAVANLMMLRTFIEEIKVECEPEFDYINSYEINNQRWKKLFLAPDTVPPGTELQKKAVRTKLLTFLPFLETVTQDEIDATCMSIVAASHSIAGTTEEIKTQKKQRPFQYNIQFIGAEDDDAMLDILMETYSGPDVVINNGILMTEMNGRGDFNKHIYKTMGAEDKLVIAKYKSKYYGNLTLEHKIGNLASSFDYIYALIWRKTRK